MQVSQSHRSRAGLLLVALLLAACSSGAEGTPIAKDVGPSADRATASPATPVPATARPSATPTVQAPQSVMPTNPELLPSATSSEPASRATPAEPELNEPEHTEEAREIVALDSDASGERVRTVQERLSELGFGPGPLDGIQGRRTADAVEALQHHAGLPVTGEVDAATVAALGDDGLAVTVLEPGDSGAAVGELQRALTNGPFDAGPEDGVFGEKTVQAVYAFEKLVGLRVNGAFDGVDRVALEGLVSGDLASAEAEGRHDRRWVEVDLSRQLMAVYEPDHPSTPMLVSHMSSGNGERWCNDTAGCRVAATPTGSFTITRRISGWRESSLDIGRLYNPLYFRGGVALHGASSVPLYPASHGCVRLPMHIAEYLPGLLPNGTPVDVRR